jgi:hypothetical protein
MHIKEFYSFLVKRETIRLAKEADAPWPWTDDQILRDYKFTNVHRSHDKTTRQLIELFYNKFGQTSKQEIILINCAIFRYFGTWEFAEALGWSPIFNPEMIMDLAKTRLKNRERVFTGAYIITNQGIKAPKQEVVVRHFLQPLWNARAGIVKIANDTNRWEPVMQAMAKIKGFGGTGFMAKEVTLDMMLCKFWLTEDQLPKDYKAWTPIGPGARRGLARIMGYDPDTKIKMDEMLERILSITAQQEFLWPEKFERLVPHDIQFQLCEFDKYERVRLGEGRPRSRYRHGQV